MQHGANEQTSGTRIESLPQKDEGRLDSRIEAFSKAAVLEGGGGSAVRRNWSFTALGIVLLQDGSSTNSPRRGLMTGGQIHHGLLAVGRPYTVHNSFRRRKNNFRVERTFSGTWPDRNKHSQHCVCFELPPLMLCGADETQHIRKRNSKR